MLPEVSAEKHSYSADILITKLSCFREICSYLLSPIHSVAGMMIYTETPVIHLENAIKCG